jgi:hypothetical protein
LVAQVELLRVALEAVETVPEVMVVVVGVGTQAVTEATLQVVEEATRMGLLLFL